MSKNTELNFSRDKIKRLIAESKMAKPYTEEDPESNMLDGELDGRRVIATYAKDLLDEYFRRHPEDKIENYMD